MRVDGVAGNICEAQPAGSFVEAPCPNRFSSETPPFRGLHLSTFRLNVSGFRGIGGAFRSSLAVFMRYQGVLGGAQGVFCVRNGSGWAETWTSVSPSLHCENRFATPVEANAFTPLRGVRWIMIFASQFIILTQFRVWYRRCGIESGLTNQNCPFPESHRPTRRQSDRFVIHE